MFIKKGGYKWVYSLDINCPWCGHTYFDASHNWQIINKAIVPELKIVTPGTYACDLCKREFKLIVKCWRRQNRYLRNHPRTYYEDFRFGIKRIKPAKGRRDTGDHGAGSPR